MASALVLDDPRCDPTRGSKAAGLVAAARLGLPVLPGWLVPAEVLAPLRVAGVAALAEGRSPAAAHLATIATELDPVLVDAARTFVHHFPRGAIVRSSSSLDAEPAFAGAFATYHEVGSEDIATAIAGCVASACTRDVLARCEAAGLDPRRIEIEVLVQPWRPFDAGGVATAEGGIVRVVASDEGPAALVAGRRQGSVLTVDVGASEEAVDEPFAEVARVTRAVETELGSGRIEWGSAGDEVSLLQVRPASPRVARPASSPRQEPRRATAFRRPVDARVVARIARLATTFPGPLGEAMVLPWAVALEGEPPVSADRFRVADDLDPVDDLLEEAERASDELAADVWGRAAASARAAWARDAAALRAGDPAPLLEELSRLRPPTAADAERTLARWSLVAASLAAAGSLPHPAQLWRLTPAQVRRAVSGVAAAPPVALGPDRWEPFVAVVAATSGVVAAGVGVAPGLGAGRVHRLERGAGRPGPRAVLMAPRPVPQIAPLLWGCAGLVTVEGSDGAHLFEVARSLGVPAVTSPNLAATGVPDAGAVAAVDGDAGSIAVLVDPSASEARRGAERRVGHGGSR